MADHIGDPSEVLIVPLPAGAARYAYLSVHRVVGFSTLHGGQSLVIDLGMDGVAASLVADPNPALVQIDRWSALAVLMLGAFVGQTVGDDIVTLIDEKAREIAKLRAKDQGTSGVFLVIRIEGKIRTQPTNVSRDLGDAVVAADAVDKEALKAKHAATANAVLTAVALATDQTSPDLARVAEGVTLTLSDGRPLYSITFAAGSLKATTARVPTTADIDRIAELTRSLLANSEMATPARLLVDALRKNNSRLEGFILAWAALEMIVRKYTRNCEAGIWIESVAVEMKQQAKLIHEAFLLAGHKQYSLSSRTKALCLLYELRDWEHVGHQVNELRKRYREPLYHEGQFKESDLPVEQVIAIVRRFMALISTNGKRVVQSTV